MKSAPAGSHSLSLQASKKGRISAKKKIWLMRLIRCQKSSMFLLPSAI
jgi:hypothetical protein